MDDLNLDLLSNEFLDDLLCESQAELSLAEAIGKYLEVHSIEDLEDLTINGLSNSKECELPESLHTQILLRAVQMAKAVWAA
jgi:hypothetical protein